MTQRAARVIVLSSLLIGSGCGGRSAPTTTPVADDDGCPGELEAPDGLQPVEDPSLLAQALGEPGKGKLCEGQVYEAVAPVTVYRVWTRAKAYSQLGGWWSFAPPEGPVAAYREANAICPEWSDLDVVSSCTIQLGAHLVIGTGQSATCADGSTYPASAVNQVFIANDTRKDQVFVEGCTPGAPWPAP